MAIRIMVSIGLALDVLCAFSRIEHAYPWPPSQRSRNGRRSDEVHRALAGILLDRPTLRMLYSLLSILLALIVGVSATLTYAAGHFLA